MHKKRRDAEIELEKRIGLSECPSGRVLKVDGGYQIKMDAWLTDPTPKQVAQAIRHLSEYGRANANGARKAQSLADPLTKVTYFDPTKGKDITITRKDFNGIVKQWVLTLGDDYRKSARKRSRSFLAGVIG